MAEKLAISRVLAALDAKDRNFYDNLSEGEKKAFTPFLLVRYASCVQGMPELQEWYLAATNQYLNSGYWELTKDPKLQWLILTAISPGMGKQFHKWIGMKKNDSSNSKVSKFIEEMYPDLNDDEISLLLQTTSKKELKELALKHGWTDKQIKTFF